MARRDIWIFIVILVILVFCLWVLIPIDSTRFGRTGIVYGLDLAGGVRLVYKADLTGVEPGKEGEVIDGVAAVVANRINPLGVTEPNIERRSTDQIIVELPMPKGGITETQIERLGRTALLEFREQVDVKDAEGKVTGQEWVPAKATIDGVEKILNSSYFKENTYVTTNPTTGAIILLFEWNAEGSLISKEVTTRLIGKPLGIYEGSGADAVALLGDDNQPIAPTVEAVITDRGEVTGLSLTEATALSKQLNAGRLPVPLELIGQETRDPSLGADFVKLSVLAGIIGVAGTMLFLIAYYRVPGLVATFSLAFYAVLTLTIYKLIPVTMTLSGIGGFVLSIGMAIDANVLIFERLKEELLSHTTLGAANEAGFSRAWTAIWDSNVTTILACLILFWVGSTVAFGGAVKGFALTLGIGVMVSMFTAIITSRTILRMVVRTGLAKRPELFKPYTGRKIA